MRKKLACTLLVTAMTAVTLAGCGSSNNAAGDPLPHLQAAEAVTAQQALLHPAVQLKPAR